MKSVSFYSSHVLLAVHLISWCTTNQVKGTQFPCDDDQDGYFRIVSDGGNTDTSQLSGRVEICYDPPGGGSPRDWYSVCGDNNWNDNTAAVVCEHLGFSETGSSAVFGSADNTDVVECTEFDRFQSNCDDIIASCSRRARVQCEPAQCRNGEIRLRSGDANQTLVGLVEICFNQQWGTIELDGWGNAEANVACGQLGFSNEGAIVLNTGFEFGRGPIHFVDFGCNGIERSLRDCVKGTDARDDHNDDARVSCMPGVVTTTTTTVDGKETTTTTVDGKETTTTTVDGKEDTSTEPLTTTESQDNIHNNPQLVIAAAVLGVLLLVTLVILIITCIILVKKTTSVRDRRDTHQHTNVNVADEHRQSGNTLNMATYEMTDNVCYSTERKHHGQFDHNERTTMPYNITDNPSYTVTSLGCSLQEEI